MADREHRAFYIEKVLKTVSVIISFGWKLNEARALAVFRICSNLFCDLFLDWSSTGTTTIGFLLWTRVNGFRTTTQNHQKRWLSCIFNNSKDNVALFQNHLWPRISSVFDQNTLCWSLMTWRYIFSSLKQAKRRFYAQVDKPTFQTIIAIHCNFSFPLLLFPIFLISIWPTLSRTANWSFRNWSYTQCVFVCVTHPRCLPDLTFELLGRKSTDCENWFSFRLTAHAFLFLPPTEDTRDV